jgi:hypothetical protein
MRSTSLLSDAFVKPSSKALRLIFSTRLDVFEARCLTGVLAAVGRSISSVQEDASRSLPCSRSASSSARLPSRSDAMTRSRNWFLSVDPWSSTWRGLWRVANGCCRRKTRQFFSYLEARVTYLNRRCGLEWTGMLSAGWV